MALLELMLALAPAPAAAPPPLQDPPKEEVVEEKPAPEKAPAKEKEAPAEAAPAEASPYLAIVGGEIHTVGDGVIARGTVLCKDGRILKVGSKVRVPEGATVIDAAGMKVYPGLVAVNSSGIVQGRGDAVADDYDPFALNVDLGLAGGLTAVQSGGAVAKLVRHSIDDVVLAQADWVTLSYSTSSPRGRRELRDKLDRARDYLRQQRAFEAAKQAGEEDAVEPDKKGVDDRSMKLLQGQAVARFNANNTKDLLSVCELIEDYPMEAVIFGGQEAWTVAPQLSRSGARLVLTPRAKSWADEELNRPNGWSIENARILWQHGIEFAIVPGQSYISTGGIAGRDLLTLPMEVAFAIRGGLPQDAALRSITIDAARILGVADRVGSIEPGKDADLIVCDGDLFDYRSFVQWAVVNGDLAYDKQKSPYFAHIRPRPEPTPAEVIEAVIEGVQAQKDEGVTGEGAEGAEPEAEAAGSGGGGQR
ncbi:MAG: amidohydrolase family protein [Planctomycetes bacterium]|nr:amidohydrolase family protein [Planctomycetota bacterium]